MQSVLLLSSPRVFFSSFLHPSLSPPPDCVPHLWALRWCFSAQNGFTSTKTSLLYLYFTTPLGGHASWAAKPRAESGRKSKEEGKRGREEKSRKIGVNGMIQTGKDKNDLMTLFRCKCKMRELVSETAHDVYEGSGLILWHHFNLALSGRSRVAQKDQLYVLLLWIFEVTPFVK